MSEDKKRAETLQRCLEFERKMNEKSEEQWQRKTAQLEGKIERMKTIIRRLRK